MLQVCQNTRGHLPQKRLLLTFTKGLMAFILPQWWTSFILFDPCECCEDSVIVINIIGISSQGGTSCLCQNLWTNRSASRKWFHYFGCDPAWKTCRHIKHLTTGALQTLATPPCPWTCLEIKAAHYLKEVLNAEKLRLKRCQRTIKVPAHLGYTCGCHNLWLCAGLCQMLLLFFS